MKKLFLTLWMMSLVASGTAWAQAADFSPNAAGITMGHWHLISRDVEANKKMFIAMGGTASKSGDLDVVTFPGVAVFLNQGAGKPPATGGTDGSSINHVGFTVPNVPEAVAKWKVAGVPVQPGHNNRTDQAFIETPEGTLIEILENKTQKVPIQHGHIHFWVPSAAAIPEIQAWYVKAFGATAGTWGNNVKAADIPGASLVFSAPGSAIAPTKGRAIDHIGFEVTSLDALCKRLDAAGIKYDRRQTGNVRAYLTDPWGTLIEVAESHK